MYLPYIVFIIILINLLWWCQCEKCNSTNKRFQALMIRRRVRALANSQFSSLIYQVKHIYIHIHAHIHTHTHIRIRIHSHTLKPSTLATTAHHSLKTNSWSSSSSRALNSGETAASHIICHRILRCHDHCVAVTAAAAVLPWLSPSSTLCFGMNTIITYCRVLYPHSPLTILSWSLKS